MLLWHVPASACNSTCSHEGNRREVYQLAVPGLVLRQTRSGRCEPVKSQVKTAMFGAEGPEVRYCAVR